MVKVRRCNLFVWNNVHWYLKDVNEYLELLILEFWDSTSKTAYNLMLEAGR